MGMTLSQKILAKKAGLDHVSPGQLIMARVDLVLGNDITGPVAINEFEKAGFNKVFDKNKIALVMDHFTPNKDIKAAEQCKQCREFARKHSITHFYDTGKAGIEHNLLPEKGMVAPSELIIGADSHTCTYGALGAFSTGVGSTDMAAAMATGELWFKVPDAILFNMKGSLNEHVCGKDVILHIIGEIGVDGALYKSMEFIGEGLKSLSIFDRLTMSNMAIEAGAKNGIFETDEITLDYIKSTVGDSRKYEVVNTSHEEVGASNTEYSKVIEIDLSKIKPTVAFPHLPGNTKTIDEIKKMNDIEIHQVVIGSCTNGWLSDMEIAANILKGNKVADGVRCIIFPGTQQIFLDCIRLGYAEAFIEAGCVFNTPTCGPCLGGHSGILAEGERCVSTTNRNFVGRMGHCKSEVYLASPAVAAMSALKGRITL